MARGESSDGDRSREQLHQRSDTSLRVSNAVHSLPARAGGGGRRTDGKGHPLHSLGGLILVEEKV